MISRYKLYYLLLIPVMSSCMFFKTPRKILDCQEPPVQNCQPKLWNGLPMDSSQNFRMVSDYWYSFEQVKNINTPDDEWCLSFLDKKKTILTLNDNNQQKMMFVKMNSYNRASVESGVGVPFDGSSGAISAAGKTVVFAGTYPNNDIGNLLGNTDLFIGELDGSSIKNIKNLGNSVHLNKYTWESQPAISSNEDVIFFSSDREPVKGLEIWFTVKLSNGSWSIPINCGDSVNSGCDEITPFLTRDGKTLLFSSCGHETVGGYDIFSSQISPEFWNLVKSKNITELQNSGKYFSKAKNLRPPLNTPGDEIFPTSPDDPNELLYYSSNQASDVNSIVLLRGGFDIFVRKKNLVPKAITKKTEQEELKVELNLPKPSLKIPPDYKLYGKVYNARTHAVIPNATIRIRQTDGPTPKIPRKNVEINPSSNGMDNFTINTNETGSYSADLWKDREYEVTAQAPNLFYDTYKSRIEPEDPIAEVNKDFLLPEIMTLRVNFPYNIYNNPYKYTLDSTGVETNQSWQETIDMLAENILLAKNQLEKIILTGNTDDQGGEQYNYKLGLNRVNFIISQLIKKGVPEDLLQGKSAGKSELLPQLTDETIQMWQKRCRRVELQKIMKKS